jgi:hypothetical protein
MSKYLRNRLCIPINGFNRTIVYDLTRKDYYFIPNDLFDLLNSDNIINIDNTEYIDFLLLNEIIFEIDNDDEVLLFPPFQETFETPYDIICLIIDVDSNLSILKINNFLIDNLTIIVDKKQSNLNEDIISILKLIEVESVNLVFTKSEYLDIAIIHKLEVIPEISLITIFECENKIKINCSINLTIIPQNFENYSKNVFPNKFSVNYDTFIESNGHNTYFNKKIYINNYGNILNGNLSTDLKSENNLDLFLKNNEYLKLNQASKDKTLVCNVCEFRRMCVDSRVPIFNEKTGFWYHKEECRYNPYLSKWENEIGYKDLKSCNITISDNGDLKIENFEELFAHINTIWNND